MKANWSAMKVPSIVLIGMIGITAGAWLSGIRFNMTPSEPVGLYQTQPVSNGIARGDLIEFCYSGEKLSFMFPGRCANNSAPLFKSVVGVPGDLVVVGDAGVMVNGELLESSRPALHSFSDPSLTLPVLRGRFLLSPGQYWTYGSGEPERSFDSRYFGSVDIKDITSVAKGNQ